MVKSLKQIITSVWHAAGNEGEPPVTFARDWRERNPEYGRCQLIAQFKPGSTMPVGLADLVDDDDENATAPRAVLVRRLEQARETLAWAITQNHPAAFLEGERERIADLEAELNQRGEG